MSLTYRDLFKVSLKYYDYLVHKSLFVHQFAKNISASGDMVEEDFRNLLSNILPDRFRVTHGYIVYCDSMEHEPVVSPQVDIIIVDNLVPNVLFAVDDKKGTEIVPKEAVVGIIEVKRTLDKNSFKESLRHLKEILDKILFDKASTERYLLGGLRIERGIKDGYYNNPLVGIMSLESTKEYFKKGMDKCSPGTFVYDLNAGKILSSHKDAREKKYARLDFAVAMDGFGVFTYDNDGEKMEVKNIWPEKPGRSYLRKPIFDGCGGWTREGVIGCAFGFILAYLSKTSGAFCDVNKYFFNHVLYDFSANREEE